MPRILLIDDYDEGSDSQQRRRKTFHAVLHAISGKRVETVHWSQLNPSALNGASHVILSGSPKNITDKPEDLERINALTPLMRQATKKNIPVLGICYGHEFIAHYLGGRVEQCLEGEHGAFEKKIDRNFTLRAGLPAAIAVQEHHDYCVSGDSAQAFFSQLKDYTIDEKTGQVETLTYAKAPILGVQFHPETQPDWADSKNTLEKSAYIHGKVILANFLRT